MIKCAAIELAVLKDNCSGSSNHHDINLDRITMIAVLRNKLPLNSLWKVVGLVIALQLPVLADLNHDHDHDHEGLTSEQTVCLQCSLIGTSSDADAAIDCFRSAQTASSSIALRSHAGAGDICQQSIQPPSRAPPF